MTEPRTCDICLHQIMKLSDHDPANHVAKAYHYAVGWPEPACVSCHEAWPCPTYEEYGRSH